MEYHVVWKIDIEADSPREAAEKALAIQRNPEGSATFFDVAVREDPDEDYETIELPWSSDGKLEE